ncbi:MAG: UDP-N-acetylmuramoyl-tripeptide--D-alanyl-D-alanine ligase [Flammeovirgaceae bacterium]
MIDQIYSLFQASTGVSTDTRNLKGGELFIALKGPNFNGNQFAQKALDAGVSAVLVDEADYVIDDRVVLVQDGLKALQDLAHHHRMQFNIPVIAITGSNGKTTTKELLYGICSNYFTTWATAGNFNNHIGVPLTLLAMPTNTELAIIEMGDNQLGDVTELCEIAHPTHGLITNIGKDHIEGFGSFEGNIRAKSELFHYLIQHQGVPFIHSADPILKNMAKRFRNPIFYGSVGDFSNLTFLETNPFIKYKTESGQVIQTQLFGKYNFDNIQTVACIGKFFNIPAPLIHQAIQEYTPKNNRSQIIEKATATIILDAYNANPSSMKAALESLDAIDTDRYKIAILGDMLELGRISKVEHKEMVELAKQLPIHQVLFCGKEFYQVQDGQQLFFEHKSELEDYLRTHPIENAFVLMKGSRGIGLETLLEWID